MKFINFAKYGDLDKIARDRPSHFAYADRLRAQGELAIGGPLLDDQGRRIGLLFVYNAVSRDAAPLCTWPMTLPRKMTTGQK